MIDFLQINIGVFGEAQALALSTAGELGVDLLIISEPYRVGSINDGWYSDGNRKAAVVVIRLIAVEEVGPV